MAFERRVFEETQKVGEQFKALLEMNLGSDCIKAQAIISLSRRFADTLETLQLEQMPRFITDEVNAFITGAPSTADVSSPAGPAAPPPLPEKDAEDSLSQEAHPFECRHCGAEVIGAGNHRRHVAACQRRSPTQRIKSNDRMMAKRLQRAKRLSKKR